MTEEPTRALWRMRWNNLGLVGLVAALMVASLLAGQYLERSRAMTPEAKLQIALQAFRSGYDETALYILTPLADEGNSKAQYWLADIYQNGLGVKPEATKAVSLFEKSAAQGFVPAQR